MSALREQLRASGMPPLLLRFWLWIAVSTLASAVFTACMIAVLHNDFAYGMLRLWNDGFQWDLWVFQKRFAHFRTPQFWDAFRYPFTYPATMGVVLAGMFKVPHIVKLYLLTCLAAVTAGAWVAAREIAARCGASRIVALAFTLSIAWTAWPVWMLYASANTEGLVAIIVAGGVWATLRRSYWIAAALLAFAGALKIFPLALLGLLLSRKRYREFAFGLALAAALNIASLAILGPSIAEAQRHITAGLAFVKYIYALNVSRFQPDVSHSLFAPVKYVLVVVHRVLHPGVGRMGEEPLLNIAYNIYVPAVCVFGVLLYFMKIRRMPMLSQVFALTICAILLPPFSVDYTLLHLLLPLGLLCVYAAETWHDGVMVKGLQAYFVCFALLFPVGTFFTLEYRFGSLVRCFALCALLLLAVRIPLRWKTLDEPEGQL